MLATEIHARSLPDLFSRFESLIGEKHWLSRVRLIKDAIKGNPFLREYLVAENEIAFQLDFLSGVSKAHGGRIPLSIVNDWGIHHAARFIGQVLSFVDDLPKIEVERFCRRVHGAFRNPGDMRGLHLEMLVATRFVRQGRKVSWPEITGEGTFDLLIEDVEGAGLEVECKSISNDKGRKIHHSEMLEFLNLVRPHVKAMAQGLENGVYGVLTLPNRLPKSYKERLEMAKDFGMSISKGEGRTLNSGANTRVGNFDISKIGESIRNNQSPSRSVIEEIIGVVNQKYLLLSTKEGGALIMVIQSSQDDELLKATFDTLGKAAKSQLSGARAGLLMVNFPDMSANDVALVFQEDQRPGATPSALRLHMDRFLLTSGREHLIGISFLSGDSTRLQEHNRISEGGAAYHFSMPNSPYWSAHFDKFFL